MQPPLTTLSQSLLEGAAQQQYPTGTLYIVATPIGNIADISLRALHVLQMVDAIACEDTRNTAQLLARYGISRPLLAAHQHNEREAAEKICARLQQGERIAFVSDAGTPGISDPGAHIVALALERGLRVMPLPGASAAVAALSVSGFMESNFHFVGFLPSKAKQRETALRALQHIEASLIVYEAPHRITETVAALLVVFGPTRHIVFAREISKLFEDIHRCTLADAPAWLAADAHREKGEYVLVIQAAATSQNDDTEALRVLEILLAECSVKQAAQLAAQITGLKKNYLYDLALKMQAK